MKIGICGTHSTGKTTLVEALRTEKQLEDYYFDINVTRWIKSIGLPLNDETNDASQEVNLTKRIAHLFCHDNIISDRTIIDVYAYSQESKNLSERSLEYQWDLIDKAIDEYDFIFYLPVMIPLIDDGTRILDSDYRKRIDDRIISLLESLRVEYIPIVGSIRERVTTVLDVINETSTD